MEYSDNIKIFKERRIDLMDGIIKLIYITQKTVDFKTRLKYYGSLNIRDLRSMKVCGISLKFMDKDHNNSKELLRYLLNRSDMQIKAEKHWCVLSQKTGLENNWV